MAHVNPANIAWRYKTWLLHSVKNKKVHFLETLHIIFGNSKIFRCYISYLELVLQTAKNCN